MWTSQADQWRRCNAAGAACADIAGATGLTYALAAAGGLHFSPASDQGALNPGCMRLFVALIAAIPFATAGHTGVLGEGVYTNDHAAQLYWADWLQRALESYPIPSR